MVEGVLLCHFYACVEACTHTHMYVCSKIFLKKGIRDIIQLVKCLPDRSWILNRIWHYTLGRWRQEDWCLFTG